MEKMKHITELSWWRMESLESLLNRRPGISHKRQQQTKVEKLPSALLLMNMLQVSSKDLVWHWTTGGWMQLTVAAGGKYEAIWAEIAAELLSEKCIKMSNWNTMWAKHNTKQLCPGRTVELWRF